MQQALRDWDFDIYTIHYDIMPIIVYVCLQKAVKEKEVKSNITIDMAFKCLNFYVDLKGESQLRILEARITREKSVSIGLTVRFSHFNCKRSC